MSILYIIQRTKRLLRDQTEAHSVQLQGGLPQVDGPGGRDEEDQGGCKSGAEGEGRVGPPSERPSRLSLKQMNFWSITFIRIHDATYSLQFTCLVSREGLSSQPIFTENHCNPLNQNQIKKNLQG